MTITYRDGSYYSGYNTRGVTGQTFNTEAGDTVLALWMHYASSTTVTWNFDDAAFTVVAGGSGTTYDVGMVRPTPGSHHIDCLNNNGGINCLAVFMLQSCGAFSFLDVDQTSGTPGFPHRLSLTLDSLNEGIVCTAGTAACVSNTTDLSFWKGETETYFDGNYNGDYPALAGYKVCTSTSVESGVDLDFGTGGPSDISMLSVTLAPGAIRGVISASLSHKQIAIPSMVYRTRAGY